jgi:hypothetical protein
MISLLGMMTQYSVKGSLLQYKYHAMKKIELVGLEIHAAHTCNLNCFNCCHFSNHRVGGVVSVEDADRWMQPWKDRLYPRRFTIIGGEPTLNPDLCRFVTVSRKNWPESRIHIATNGFFLHKHPDLPRVMKDVGNIAIVMNKVHDDKTYEQKYKEIVALCESWKSAWGIDVQYIFTAHDRTRRYEGFGELLVPLGCGDYELSYKVCEAKESKTLFESRLFKCSRLAYLRLISRYFKLSEQWTDSLAYQSLSPNCSDQELEEWAKEKANPACVNCPVQVDLLTNLPSPLRTEMKML